MGAVFSDVIEAADRVLGLHSSYPQELEAIRLPADLELRIGGRAPAR
jgi:hypothetical protein